MKRLLIALFFLFSISSVSAQKTAESITVLIQAGKFSINKANVTNDWRQDIVSVALDGDDRRRAGANTTHSYDDFGIVLFERNTDKVPSGKLSEIQFYISAGDTNAVSAKGFFKGKMKIENLVITSKLTSENLKKSLKDYVETNSYMPHNFRLSYRGIYIYFQFNDEEDTLRKVSVGKDTKG